MDVDDVEFDEIVPRRLEDAERKIELPVIGKAVVEVAEAAHEDAVDHRFRLVQALLGVKSVGRPHGHRLTELHQRSAELVRTARDAAVCPRRVKARRNVKNAHADPNGRLYPVRLPGASRVWRRRRRTPW